MKPLRDFRGDIGHDLIALSFETPLGAGSARTVASWYRFSDAIDFTGLFESDGRSNASDPALRADLIDVVFTRAVEIRDLALRQEFLAVAGVRHLLDFGFEIHDLDTRWGWDIPAGRNPNVANGSSVQGGAGLPELLDSRVKSTRLGAWLSDRFQVTPALTVEPVVMLGHGIRDYRRLLADHEVDLMVLHTRDQAELALHGTAYLITAEFRKTPLLLI